MSKYQMEQTIRWDFWLFIEQELTDLQALFSQLFTMPNLYWDYENHWEWLTAEASEQITWLNISRAHQQQGCYDQPLVISLNISAQLADTQAAWAYKLAQALNCTVYVGQRRYLGGNDFSYDVHYAIEAEHTS